MIVDNYGETENILVQVQRKSRSLWNHLQSTLKSTLTYDSRVLKGAGPYINPQVSFVFEGTVPTAGKLLPMREFYLDGSMTDAADSETWLTAKQRLLR